MQSTLRVFLLASLALASAGNALSQRGPRTSEKYQDADLGISLTLPGSWTRVPQDPRQPWTGARFVADRGKVEPELRATFRVVVLPEDADVTRNALTVDPGDPYAIRPEGNGLSTYAALVEATTTECNSDGKKFEVTPAGDGKDAIGPYQDFRAWSEPGGWSLRRARVFARAGMKIAIEVSLPEPRKGELEPLWKEILASVRPFSGPKPAPIGPDPWLAPRLRPDDYPAWLAMPVAKRHELRARAEELWSQALKERTHLPWQCNPSKRFTVVSTLGTAGTPYVTNLEVFAAYLDSVLGPLSDDRVRRGVLRIVTDSEQRDVFEVVPQPTTGCVEMVMLATDGDDDAVGIAYGAVQRAMFWNYLHDKNPVVGAVLPRWIDEGLDRGLYYSSRVHGNGVDFERDDLARKEGRSIAKNGDLTPLHLLVTSDRAAFHDRWVKADQKKIRFDIECQLAVMFLLAKDQPIPQLQNFLTRYFRALGKECAEAQSVRDEAARAHFLDAAHERVNAQVFGTDPDVWRKIDRAYAAYVGRLTACPGRVAERRRASTAPNRFAQPSAATPGSTLPSSSSRLAPPPVDTCDSCATTPVFSAAATESPPPTTENAPAFVCCATARASASVPLANASISNTPIGPFQTIVLLPRSAST